MIEAERVPDRQYFLSHMQIMRCPDREGRERLFRRTNLQYRHIMVGICADEGGLMLGPIGQRHGNRIRPVYHMKIGDDMSLFVPDESGPGTLWNFKEIERPGVSLNRRIRNKNHGFRHPFEYGNRGSPTC